MTNSKIVSHVTSQKINIFLINILFMLSFLSAIYQFSFVYREGLLLIVFLLNLCMKMMNEKRVKRSSVIIIIVGLTAMVIGFTGNYSETFITARSVLFYPMLCFVGGSLAERKTSLKSLSMNYLLCTVILSIFGTIEFILPSMFERLMAILRITYEQDNLLRGSLGYGLGSLFVSRQYFSTFLCLGIVIILNMKSFTNNRILTNKVIQWAGALWFLILIGLTLSRTILVAAIVVVVFNIIKDFSVKRVIPIVLGVFILLLLAYRVPIVRDSINSATESINAMDTTMSGRTEIWKGYFDNLISVFPKFVMLGNTEHAESVGVADSVYIRFLVAYGYMLSLVIISFLGFRLLRVWNNKLSDKRLFFSIVLFLMVASVAIDISFMFMIMVPLYICLGYEYNQIVNQRKVNIS